MTQPTTPRGVSQLKELLFDRETRRLDDLGRRLDQEASAAATRHADIQRQHADIQRQHADMQRQQTEQDRKHDETNKRQQELAERLAAVFERAGSTEKLQHSVAEVIDGALREAEIVRHEPLSRAIAPLVVRTIKVQLKESQDEMVEALYPITGRLVQSYVQSAMNEMMVQINAKLGGSGAARIAAASDATGVPASELALAEANKLEVEELFLVRRRTGELVAHWEHPDAAQRGKPASANQSRDQLFSSYLSGIMSLSEETFGATPGSFRTLSLANGDRIFVRGSAAHLLAVRCTGGSGASVERVIDEVFLQTIEQYQRLLSDDEVRARSRSGPTADDTAGANALLPQVGQAIEHITAERRAALLAEQAKERAIAAKGPGFGRVYAMFAALATPFLIWGGWSLYQSIMTSRTEAVVQRALEPSKALKGIPPHFDVERGGRSVTISGYVPDAKMRTDIIAQIKREAPKVVVLDQLGVLPADAGPAQMQIQLAIAALRSEIDAERLHTNLERPVDRAQARIAQTKSELLALGRQATTADRTALDEMTRALADAEQALSTARAAIKNGARPPLALVDPLTTAWQRLAFAEGRFAHLLGVPQTATAQKVSPPSQPDSLAADVAMAAERLAAAPLGLGHVYRLGTLDERVSRLKPPTARDQLEATVRGSAIFFDNGIDLRNAATAQATLDQLTKELRDVPDAVLRVVGYTDERGTQALNSGLAQQRADRIATLLIERGIPANRLVTVGRLTGKDLSRSVGPASTNRRVEFEIAYLGETGGQP